MHRFYDTGQEINPAAQNYYAPPEIPVEYYAPPEDFMPLRVPSPESDTPRERTSMAKSLRRFFGVSSLALVAFTGFKYNQTQQIEQKMIPPTITVYNGQVLLYDAMQNNGVATYLDDEVGVRKEVSIGDLISFEDEDKTLVIKIPQEITSPDEAHAAKELVDALEELGKIDQFVGEAKIASQLAAISLSGFFLSSYLASRHNRRNNQDLQQTWQFSPFAHPTAGLILSGLMALASAYSTIIVADSSNLLERARAVKSADFEEISELSQDLSAQIQNLNLRTEINDKGQLEIRVDNQPDEITAAITQANSLANSLPSSVGIDNPTGIAEYDRANQAVLDLVTFTMAYITALYSGLSVSAFRQRSAKRRA